MVRNLFAIIATDVQTHNVNTILFRREEDRTKLLERVNASFENRQISWMILVNLNRANDDEHKRSEMGMKLTMHLAALQSHTSNNYQLFNRILGMIL
jgi:hypothetical protein